MEQLKTKVRSLLEGGTVKVVIGHGPGSTPERSRPLFVRRADQADQLVANGHCGQNLALYLLKAEVKALGKAAIVAHVPELRTLLQYAAESQLPDDSVIALAVSDDGKLTELVNFAAVEEYLATVPRGMAAEAKEEIARRDGQPLAERWAFWAAEMERCIKCYACRAACPLCYCSRCIVDCNQPQWVPAATDALGNLEWNVVRAMHLAGRCVACGSCAAACPQNIRIDLLNHVLAQEASAQFSAEPGYSQRKEYALAAFKPDDKEEFIR